MTLLSQTPTTALASALDRFDAAAPVDPEEIRGRWHGAEYPTGHPMDGLLAASGWYGKQFDGPDAVHPLLFRDWTGRIFSVEPRRAPMGMLDHISPRALAAGRVLLPLLRPVLATRKPRARLRTVEYRGVATASMVYDHLPIIDHFRRISDDELMGIMDLRGVPQPYAFSLFRD